MWLADLRVAFTGTNPRPVLLDGTKELCGAALDERVFKGLDELVRDQIMVDEDDLHAGALSPACWPACWRDGWWSGCSRAKGLSKNN